PFIGAADRDPAQFPDPDRLDITRADNRHIAFGWGVHFCLGAPLARIEGQIAINALLQRMPKLALATDTPQYRQSLTLRGLSALPVSFYAVQTATTEAGPSTTFLLLGSR